MVKSWRTSPSIRCCRFSGKSAEDIFDKILFRGCGQLTASGFPNVSGLLFEFCRLSGYLLLLHGMLGRIKNDDGNNDEYRGEGAQPGPLHENKDGAGGETNIRK